MALPIRLALAALTVTLLTSLALMLVIRRLDPAIQGQIARRMLDGGVLAGLALIPLVLWIVTGTGAAVMPVVLGGLLIWAILLRWYWEVRVSPLVPLLPALVSLRPPLPGPYKPELDQRSAAIPWIGGKHVTHRSFSWEYHPPRLVMPGTLHSVRQSIAITIDRTRYETCRQEEPLPRVEWSHYAAANMPEVRMVAAALHNLHRLQSWSSFEQASNVLALIEQCIACVPGAAQPHAGSRPRYPIETLLDATGDADDVLILAAAFVVRLGFPVVLAYYGDTIVLGVGGAEGLPGEFMADHSHNRRYFAGVPSSSGWHFGELPEPYRGSPPTLIVPVMPASREHRGK